MHGGALCALRAARCPPRPAAASGESAGCPRGCSRMCPPRHATVCRDSPGSASHRDFAGGTHTIVIGQFPLAGNLAPHERFALWGRHAHMSAATLPCHDVQGVPCASLAASARSRLAPLVCAGSADRVLWALRELAAATAGGAAATAGRERFTLCSRHAQGPAPPCNGCEEPRFAWALGSTRTSPPGPALPHYCTRRAIRALWATNSRLPQ